MGVEIEYQAQAPVPSARNDTLFPIQLSNLESPTLTTRPTPYNPLTAGKGPGIYFPDNFPLSEGLIVDPSTLISNCPYLAVGISTY